MRRLLAFGHKGKIEFIGSLEDAVKESLNRIATGTGFRLITDMMETPWDFEPVVVNFQNIPADKKDLAMRETLTEVYQDWKKFGDYGDVITFLDDDARIIITSIARKAYYKPAIAADLVLFVRDSVGKTFFVGLKRGQEPGKGKLATVGGHMDVRGPYWENAVEALNHEGPEEIGLKFLNCSSDLAAPFPEWADVTVSFLGYKLGSQLKKIGIYKTGPEEINQTTGLKRVHGTAAYFLALDVPEPLTVENILAALVPEDKAENNKVEVLEISSQKSFDLFGTFGLSHHVTIFLDAWMAYQNMEGEKK